MGPIDWLAVAGKTAAKHRCVNLRLTILSSVELPWQKPTLFSFVYFLGLFPFEVSECECEVSCEVLLSALSRVLCSADGRNDAFHV